MYHLIPPVSLSDLPGSAMIALVKCLRKEKGPNLDIYANFSSDHKPVLYVLSEFIEQSGILDEEMDSIPPVNIHALMVKPTKKSIHTPPDRMGQNGSLIHKIHRRFAHLNFQSILETMKRSGMSGIDNKLVSIFADEVQNLHDMTTLEFCTACAEGKITQTPIRESQRKATRILEIIHTDTFPLPVESHNREKYGTIIVDGYTRYTEMVFHRRKNDTFPILVQYIKRWEDQHSPLKVGAVRHDNGELKDQFDQFCSQQNPPIFNEPSVSYVKELNGLSERTYGVHKNNAITMNLQAHLPKSSDVLSFCEKQSMSSR